MNTLLTTRQLQDLLQLDRITIYRMLRDGRLPGFKVGGQWRFSRQAIEEWLRRQRASLGVSELPAASGDLGPFPEALPLSCIQAIQGIVAEVLGLAAITTALDGAPLTKLSNSCEFCNLVLATEQGRQRCVTSWSAGVQRQGVAETITCHAGLRYVGEQIRIQGKAVAAIYAGQFLREPPGDDGWSERIAQLSMVTGVGSKVLQNVLNRVPVLSSPLGQKIPRLVRQVADTFSEIGQERLELLNRLRRIAEITTLQGGRS